MGFDLYRTIDRGRTDSEEFLLGGDKYQANVSGWSWLIEHGQDHGWEPAGTLPPEYPGYSGKNWDPMNYGSNDFQRVTDADAKAWADALDAGKPYLGESLRWQELVDEFIAYARKGGFLIGQAPAQRTEESTMKTPPRDRYATFLVILMYLGVLSASLYTGAAWFAFQWRNPKANAVSFYREFMSVMTWQKLDRYQ